ncbi:putative uncharacterized protein DDB_G0271606 isoform X2 [Condylostylus longicornis]|uniref:putative uncharacterized protein DDB_G0271606 isoform X2 n=1 Tax=Condylostylus longicornis TaxID=2530218 RepID=UPI00244E1681|nr:putative uncharacterized protein DDB_G0271606 isoform X2 [Condylostylus longicornis]
MSGYKCVNYYDLCRLCTTSSGSRINIFSEEGRKKNMSQKISECLPVVVDEKDNLPKIICETCIAQVESISEFRTVCLNSQAMLEGCINTATLQNGGKIYIKEGGMTLKNISVTSTNTVTNQTGTINQTNSDFLSSIIQAVGIQNEDIQDTKPSTLPQYTITLDGKTLSNEIEYKVQEVPITNVQPQQTQQQQATDNSEKFFKNNSLAEFLKMKPNIRVTPVKKKQQVQLQQTSVPAAKYPKLEIQHTEAQQVAVQTDVVKKTNTVMKTKKQKYNLILTSPTSKQQQTAPQIITQQQIVPTQQVQQLHFNPQNTTALVPTSTVQSTIPTKSLAVPDWKLVSAPSSKCFLPLTIKDSSNNDQQIVAQIDTKNLILPATYQLQMKLQPQLTIDGQQIVQLAPAAIPATISLAPSQSVTQTFQDHQIVSSTGIDAATSTSESEIMLNANQITNNQQQNLNMQSSNINLQQIQSIQNAAVSLPQLQIKNIAGTAALTNNVNQQVTPQKLFNNSITIHRITNAATTLQQNKTQQQQSLQQNQIQPIQQKQVQQQCSQQKQVQQQCVQQKPVQQQCVQQKQVQQQCIQQKQVQQQCIQQKQPVQQQSSQNQVSQSTTQVQYLTTSGSTKLKPVKLIRTTKLTPAQAKQQNTITTQKLPVRRPQPTNITQPPSLATLTVTQRQQEQSQHILLKQPPQQQHQSQNQQQLQQQQVQQQQPQQQQSLPVQRQNNVVKKTLPVKTSNPALAHTTPSAAAALATVNPVTNLLECSVCSRGFKKKEHLAQHMKLHAGLRPFKCSEPGCTKAFSRKEHLMRHIVSHTGKKMFCCDMCQKFFSRKDNLNKHKRTHSEQSSNSRNQFVCNVCYKSFVVKMYYLQHKLLHVNNEQQQTDGNSKFEQKNEDTTTTNSGTITTNSDKFNVNTTTQINNNTGELNSQIKLETRQELQQKNQPQLVQLQLPVATSNDFNGGTITISQADGTTTTVLKTLANHDATVLNLPTSLANYMQLNSAQFITTSGEIVGHIKIEK